MKNAEIYVGIGVAAVAIGIGAMFYNKNSKVDPKTVYEKVNPTGNYTNDHNGGGSNKKTRTNKKKNNKSAKNKN